MIHGQMTITALGNDDVRQLIDTMLVKIQSEMNSGNLLDPVLYPEITRIAYGHFQAKGDTAPSKGSAKSVENPTSDREYPLFYAFSEKNKEVFRSFSLVIFLWIIFHIFALLRFLSSYQLERKKFNDVKLGNSIQR